MKVMGLFFSDQRQMHNGPGPTFDLQGIFKYDDYDNQALLIGILLDLYEDQMLCGAGMIETHDIGGVDIKPEITYVAGPEEDEHFWVCTTRANGLAFPYGILRLSPIVVGEPRGWYPNTPETQQALQAAFKSLGWISPLGARRR